MVVGGIISAEDDNVLRNMGVAAVYTPKDYALDAIMADMVRVVGRAVERREVAPSDAKVKPRRRRAAV